MKIGNRLPMAVLLAIALVSCGPNKNNNGANPLTPEEPDPHAHVYEKQNDPIQLGSTTNQYNQTARYLAGLPLPEDSPLYTATQTKTYQKYQQYVQESWRRFNVPNLTKVRDWSQKQLAGRKFFTVFYPFSGPDVIYPVTMFGELSELLMFGLEKPGNIPDPVSLSPEKRVQDLRAMPQALDFILNHSFFVTSRMAKKIGHSSYSSVTGIMMLLLALHGYQVEDVRQIWVDERGMLSWQPLTTKSKGQISGVEIIFRKLAIKEASSPAKVGHDSYLRRLRFFSLDIADSSPQLKPFKTYLESYPPLTTMIKSASYLMHNSYFSQIRGAILEHSKYILQDDSGIPYNILTKGPWHLTYHGYYHRPITDFKHRYQGDLQKDVKKHSTGPLPFSYGYGYGFRNITYHLVFASKQDTTQTTTQDNKEDNKTEKTN